MIYLDYNATTPLEEAVVAAMLPYLAEHHGNPSSAHAFGAAMRVGIVEARQRVASLLGASPEEIVFTSGGSESNNHVLKGCFENNKSKPCHIITTAIEHPAILMPCAYLERNGCRISILPVDGTGMVDPDDVRKAITKETILISIMHANNEVGTIQPIAEISRIAREANVPFHTDAAQSVGKIETKVDELGVDFLSMAGHKVYAPAGIGALYIRAGRELEPLIHGAGHESGRRAGTEPVPSIVGLGIAADLSSKDMAAARIATQRGRFHSLLVEGLGDRIAMNGHPEKRLPNTLNISFKGLIGPLVLKKLTGLAASPGAACHSDRHEPSQVLSAMGIDHDVALGAVRFSLGRPTTDSEVEQAAQEIIETVRSM